MSREQNIRFWWSICHALIAAYTLWSAAESLALTSLSHLILYDSLGAMLCVVVDIFSNFEVWKRSSIRHPFGLERAEVLAGFAMSVLLVFMGMDLISHNAQHVLEQAGSHEPHHVHQDADRVTAGSIDLAALLAVLATVVSALVLNNHARIGKVMHFEYFSNLPSILSNPCHLLTLTCSCLLLLLPLLSITVYTFLDRVLSLTIALSMCAMGGHLVQRLGLMLLMSFSGNQHTGHSNSASSISDLISTIESDPLVSRVEEAKVWQVHYGLCMANFRLRVRGEEENLLRLRDRLSSLVRNKLGGGYGTGSGQRWEVNAQLVKEKVGLPGLSGSGSGLGLALGIEKEKLDGKAL
jgi:divalent metal cation (Fe/Co/Zn/Cd) transporter